MALKARRNGRAFHQGLTPAAVSNPTGHVDSNASAPPTGTGQQPGKMGAGDSKAK